MNLLAHNGVEHTTNDPVSMAHATTPNYLLLAILFFIILASIIFIATHFRAKPQSAKYSLTEKDDTDSQK